MGTVTIGNAAFDTSLFNSNNGFLYYEFTPDIIYNQAAVKFTIYYERESKGDIKSLSTYLYNPDMLGSALINLVNDLDDDIGPTDICGYSVSDNVTTKQAINYWNALTANIKVPKEFN